MGCLQEKVANDRLFQQHVTDDEFLSEEIWNKIIVCGISF